MSSTGPLPALFVTSPELEGYQYPPDCPFKTSRTPLTRQTCRTLGLLPGDGSAEYPPVFATEEELTRFHTPQYLEVLKRASRGEMGADGLHMGLGRDDAPVFRDLYDYATLACGATLTAARLILQERTRRVFTPSGGLHHARPAYAHGFCYINDIVIACEELAGAGKRVAFLDLDVHHCDGVQEAFLARNDVLVISLHESGEALFPHTGYVQEIGTGAGEGYNVNLPLPPNTYDAPFRRVYEEVAAPLLRAYAPDVLVVEAGMDILTGDPLAHLRCTNHVDADILYDLLRLDVPIIVTGGGGYHVDNTVRGWSLLWSILSDQDDPYDIGAGLGGVMMESTDWAGGLRDRAMPPEAKAVAGVQAVVDRVIERARELVFPRHGL
jgi:acetoin utilization protein AcuC